MAKAKKIAVSAAKAAFIVLLAFLFAYLIRVFVFEPYVIPSESMDDTIEIGDMVLSEKVSYRNASPQAGDIITFYNVDGEEDPFGGTLVYIKRVIAVEGQQVDIHDGRVYVDGEALDEPYTDGKRTEKLENDKGITYPFTVSEGCVWVMGDNRTHSSDSRCFGEVPVENITGKAFFRYMPITKIGSLQ